MRVMKAGMNLFNHFLWENFEVEWRKGIRESANLVDSNLENDSINDGIVAVYALNLHFINRFENDPGFKQYLINQIENDDEIIVSLGQYIETLKGTYIGNTFGSLFNLNKIDTNSIKTELDSTLEYGSENDVNHNEIKIKYLKNRLEVAEAENNFDEAIAIKSLISQLENNIIGMYNLFQKDVPYQRKLLESHNILNSKSIRYIAENLSSFDLYLKGTGSTNLCYLPEPNQKLIYRILQLYPLETELTHDSAEQNAKFILDSLNISFVLWFEKKNEKEKLSILNTEYEFVLNDFEINKFADFHGRSKLIGLTHILYNSNYFFEAKALYEYLLKNAKDDVEKRIFISNCAVCYRETGQYKLAVQSHLQEYNMLCESENEGKDLFIGLYGFIPKNDPIFNDLRRSKAIALKNIGENYLYLNDEDTARDKFDEAIEIAKAMDDEYKLNIYFNLAYAHQRNYNYVEENYLLVKCVDLLKKISENELKSSIKEEVINRLKIHAKCFDITSSNTDKNTCLKELEMRERFTHANKIIDIGNMLFDTFQFSRSIDYYKRANQILESDYLNYRISYCYFTLYLQNITNNDNTKRLEYLKNSKKYLAGIDPKNRFKSNNKYALLLMALTYIGDSLEIGNDKSLLIGLEGLKKHILLMYSINSENHDDILASLKQCLIFSLQLKRKELLIKIFGEILNETKKHEKLTSPHCLIGMAFIEFFIDDLATYYLDEGFNEAKNKSDILDLLDSKAHTNLTISSTKKAVDHYKNAVLIDTNDSDLWFRLSLAYSGSLQFTKAKNAMQKALDIMPKEMSEYSIGTKLVVQFEEMMNKQIDLESIDEQIVKDTLISAEKEMLDSKDTDYSGSLMKYSKAIQIIMADNVYTKIHKKILMCNSKDAVNEYKDNMDNHHLFIKLLDKNKSPGLGDWSFIKKDIKQSGNEEISVSIKHELTYILDMDLMDSLESLSKILQVVRNKGTHEDVIGHKRAIEIRKKAIPHLNKIIDYFYD
jgi:hypothetical protein